jgi:hypothetical protein
MTQSFSVFAEANKLIRNLFGTCLPNLDFHGQLQAPIRTRKKKEKSA